MEKNAKWTLEIRPKKHIFDINLKEVWKYKDLIFLFVRRDFVAKYKQTLLGPFWFILQPLFTTLIYTVIFGKIAGISTDGLPKMLFYMSGITAWNYFSNSFRSTSNTFVANAGIFGKVYFPRLTIPISAVISGLIQFLIQFSFLVAFMIYFKINGSDFHTNWYVLLIPVLIVLMAGIGLGLGIIVSSMTTKYRDLTNFLSFGIQLWMYSTPIIYPLSEIPVKYKFFIQINPITPIIEAFRYALLGKGDFDFVQLLYSFVFMIVALAIGIVMFNKVEQSFMDTV